MYKVSVWLKGGGKIVEEIECDSEYIISVYRQLTSIYSDQKNIPVYRSGQDPLPISISSADIAAVQIDKKGDKPSYIPGQPHPRKLETRLY